MPPVDRTVKPSFTKGLFQGHTLSDLVMPYPLLEGQQKTDTDAAVDNARDFLAGYDPWKAEEQGWIGDDVIAELGERKLTGLFIDQKYGGLGLSQTGYCRVMEEFGRVDGTLSVVMGVHQSIGTKPLFLYGSDEQKERWLPDLASGRKLAAFVLTEPNVGSDAYNLETSAERQSDGSWLLNGEKRWIGDGSKDVLTVFARSDLGHVALVVEGGMDGLSYGPRFETLGLKANNLQRVHFNNVRVPAENLIGEPGDGFRIAMNTLNNGRMSMGTAISGGMKYFLELALEHTSARRQFDRALIDFEMVEEKLSWMAGQIYGLESSSYLTTGLVDRGVADFSLESAMTKVESSDRGWYALNRAFQLLGGEAFMANHPLSKALRDFRIFPIFEGANDVMRAYVALNGLKALGDDLPDMSGVKLSTPGTAIGTLAPYVRGRIDRRLRPEKLEGAHPVFAKEVATLAEQTVQLRNHAETALRRYGKKVQEKQLVQKRLAEAASGIYSQVAAISRATAVIQRDGLQISGAEKTVATNYLRRTAAEVEGQFRGLEKNDDRFVSSIGQSVKDAGGYPFVL